MGKRREAREAAVQFLVYCDLNRPPADAPAPGVGEEAAAAEAFWELRPAPTQKKVRDFALELARGALAHREESDGLISRYAKNYDLHRIAAVDRNVLRLALFEMYHRDEVPPIVAINEAIEIAKRFGTEESGRFVNGILDRAKLDLNRPLRTANERFKPSSPQGSNKPEASKEEPRTAGL